MRYRLWRKTLLVAAAVAWVIAWPLLVLPQAAQRFQSTPRSVSLVAVMPEAASLAWSVHELPRDLSEPDVHAEILFLQDQSVLGRGRSSEVHCEWEGAVGNSSGLLPLAGFPGLVPFQFSFLPRSPVRKLVFPAASGSFSSQENRSAAFMALYSSRDAANAAIIHITISAF